MSNVHTKYLLRAQMVLNNGSEWGYLKSYVIWSPVLFKSFWNSDIKQNAEE